jgi:hypothetical protein
MKRSNRSIEVFDISLMAVVTKAMGAFLVLMLLLMPYYSSGPLGGTTIGDLNDEIDALDKQIQTFSADVAKKKPDELKKTIDELLARLKKARELIDLLKRQTDALNAQVARLEDLNKDLTAQIEAITKERDELKAEIASLKDSVEDLTKRNEKLTLDFNPGAATIMGVAISENSCEISVGALKIGSGVLVDHKEIEYPLNLTGSTLGSFYRTVFSARNTSWFYYDNFGVKENYVIYGVFKDALVAH